MPFKEILDELYVATTAIENVREADDPIHYPLEESHTIRLRKIHQELTDTINQRLAKDTEVF